MRVQAMIAASEGTLELEQGASPSRGPSALTIQNDTARALNSAVYSHRIPWSQIDAKPFETVVFLKILRAWLAPSASKRDRQLGHAVRPGVTDVQLKNFGTNGRVWLPNI